MITVPESCFLSLYLFKSVNIYIYLHGKKKRNKYKNKNHQEEAAFNERTSKSKSSNTLTPAQNSARGGQRWGAIFYTFGRRNKRNITKGNKNIESPIPRWMQVKDVCCC
jgi:hypothetical protein